MTDTILFVDDEQNVLDGLRRQLRKTFSVETALGPVEGLQAVNRKGLFAVVVSDLRMPVMDGIKFLMRIKERTPDSVRMVLTGNADRESAIKAVNDGQIFRFLTKPWKMETAAMLSQIGLLTLPGQCLEKLYQGQTLSLQDEDNDFFKKGRLCDEKTAHWNPDL